MALRGCNSWWRLIKKTKELVKRKKSLIIQKKKIGGVGFKKTQTRKK